MQALNCYYLKCNYLQLCYCYAQYVAPLMPYQDLRIKVFIIIVI